MIWFLFTWLFANFARVFRSGIALLLIVPYAMYPDLDWKNDTDEYRRRWMVVSNWFISFSIFAASNQILFRFGVRDQKIQMPRDRKIRDLRIGVAGLVICAIVQLVACIYMKANEGDGNLYVTGSHCAATLLISLYIMEQSYMCKIPNKFEMIHQIMITFAILFGSCLIFLDETYRFEVVGYLIIIECLLVDGYILFFHSSEIHFLQDFIERQVICKDKSGNEWRGRFTSVDRDFLQNLNLRLYLTDVKLTVEDGIMSVSAEDCYIDEIESLELAEKESIENYPKCQKQKILKMVNRPNIL